MQASALLSAVLLSQEWMGTQQTLPHSFVDARKERVQHLAPKVLGLQTALEKRGKSSLSESRL